MNKYIKLFSSVCYLPYCTGSVSQDLYMFMDFTKFIFEESSEQSFGFRFSFITKWCLYRDKNNKRSIISNTQSTQPCHFHSVRFICDYSSQYLYPGFSKENPDEMMKMASGLTQYNYFFSFKDRKLLFFRSIAHISKMCKLLVFGFIIYWKKTAYWT